LTNNTTTLTRPHAHALVRPTGTRSVPILRILRKEGKPNRLGVVVELWAFLGRRGTWSRVSGSSLRLLGAYDRPITVGARSRHQSVQKSRKIRQTWLPVRSTFRNFRAFRRRRGTRSRVSNSSLHLLGAYDRPVAVGA